MPALRRAWEAAEPLETELAAEKAARKADSETWSELFDQHVKQVGSHFARQYGFPTGGEQGYEMPDTVKSALPEPTPVPNGVAKADHALIGTFIKGERVKRQWCMYNDYHIPKGRLWEHEPRYNWAGTLAARPASWARPSPTSPS
ncbi:MAG: hypothetical protein ACREDO_11890 [Methyloceanibacter sp.]